MFNLADALARGSDALAARLQGNSGGLLGKEISLKDFAQFVDPKRILDKSPYHRNHMADFGESRGEIREKNLRYAALDARRTSEAVQAFASLLHVPIECLTSTVEEPFELDSTAFEKVTSTFLVNRSPRSRPR